MGSSAAAPARVRAALVAASAAARRASTAAPATAMAVAVAGGGRAAPPASTASSSSSSSSIPFRIGLGGGWATPFQQPQWQPLFLRARPSSSSPPPPSPLLLARRLFSTDQPDQQHKQPPGTQPTGGSWASLPNALSLSRVAAAPIVCYLLASGSPGPAVALLAAAGLTDFLDGYLARRLGHTSVLGSYLDPLGDKVLAASVAVTLASLGAAPWWLATLVAGRDAALMWGVYRARMRAFGGVWPGREKFFDVDGVVVGTQADGADEGEKSDNGKGAGGGGGGGKSGGGGGAMPPLKPLFVSKANTCVQLLFFGGCIGRLWLGEAVVPRAWLDAGEALTALTTAASAGAYLDELRKGRLPTVLGGGGRRRSGGRDDNDKRS